MEISYLNKASQAREFESIDRSAIRNASCLMHRSIRLLLKGCELSSRTMLFAYF